MFDVALINRTPFDAATHVQVDANGQEALLMVVSASFVNGTGSSLDLAPEQVPFSFADEPFSDARPSSIRVEADIALVKPKVDVIVVGSAYSPSSRPATEVAVSLRVADIHKRLRVTGDRISRAAGALPFARMPIVYERAYGGTTRDGQVHRANPIGVGYRDAASADPTVATGVPNIEYLDQRSGGRENQPAGFGVISRNWVPRVGLAGTYDQAWLDAVWPLPPKDFDPLFNQAAPADQQTAAIVGGETVELINLTEAGDWRFRLPRLDVPVRLVFEDRVEDRGTRIDTVFIDSDRRIVVLKTRIMLVKVRNAPRLHEIVLGHTSTAFLRARQLRKRYRDPRGGNGTLTERPTFHP
jgi:hypothetical protein